MINHPYIILIIITRPKPAHSWVPKMHQERINLLWQIFSFTKMYIELYSKRSKSAVKGILSYGPFSLFSSWENDFPVVKVSEAIFPTKGSLRFKKVQFFWTLFKRPLTPPLLFEHLSYFAGGVFWTRFWAFDIMYLFPPQFSPSMPQKSLFMQISCC